MRVLGTRHHCPNWEGRAFLFSFFFCAEDEIRERGKGACLSFDICKGKRLRTSQICTISLPSLRKSIISFMPFPFIHHRGQPRLAVPSPHQHSYQWEWRQHCLQPGMAEGGWGHVVSEGIYNKVALSATLKTFTQVCVLRHCRRRANSSAADR